MFEHLNRFVSRDAWLLFCTEGVIVLHIFNGTKAVGDSLYTVDLS